MISGDIRKQIKGGEKVNIAFVEDAADAAGIAATVCALLNTNGGIVFVGVTPNGDVRGVGDQPDAVRKELELALQKTIAPKALFTLSIDVEEGASILSIEVPEGRDTPYVTDGRVFVRSGKRSVAASPEELRRVVQVRAVEPNRWERRPSAALELDDLDLDQINATIEESQELGRLQFRTPSDPSGALRELNLVGPNGFTNGCDVLFAKRPAARHPQCRVRFIRYETDKTGSAYLDDLWFDAPLANVIELLIEQIGRQVSVQAYFPPGEHVRQDRFNYSIEALREGIVNAVAHRDYASFSGGVSVSVFPDRIEIWNSGRLPREISVSALKRPHPSIPVNPDIAHVLYLRRLMERVGRGTQKIVAACDELNARPPVWKNETSGVTLTIFSAAAAPGPSLNPRQAQLLETLRPGDVLKLWDYVGQHEISDRQARRDLAELEEFGLVRKSGRARATVYQRTERTV
jgi:ATP-dependent DNA helicase RecG